MKHKVKVQIVIDSSLNTPEIIIRTDQKTELVDKLVAVIEQCTENDTPRIRAYDGNKTILLEQQAILRVYTEPRKLIVCTEAGSFEARSSLQNIEKQLDPECFVRISRFEIINMKKVSAFDVRATGTIQVLFEDGSFTWVARRYVRTIEKKLGQFYGEGRNIDD